MMLKQGNNNKTNMTTIEKFKIDEWKREINNQKETQD